MSKGTAGEEEVANQPAYATAWEHLSEELRRLDLLICCRLPEQSNGTQATSLQQFGGLVLTEEEIRGLLGNPLDLSSSNADQNVEDSPNRDLQAAPRPAVVSNSGAPQRELEHRDVSAVALFGKTFSSHRI